MCVMIRTRCTGFRSKIIGQTVHMSSIFSNRCKLLERHVVRQRINYTLVMLLIVSHIYNTEILRSSVWL